MGGRWGGEAASLTFITNLSRAKTRDTPARATPLLPLHFQMASFPHTRGGLFGICSQPHHHNSLPHPHTHTHAGNIGKLLSRMQTIIGNLVAVVRNPVAMQRK